MIKNIHVCCLVHRSTSVLTFSVVYCKCKLPYIPTPAIKSTHKSNLSFHIIITSINVYKKLRTRSSIPFSSIAENILRRFKVNLLLLTSKCITLRKPEINKRCNWCPNDSYTNICFYLNVFYRIFCLTIRCSYVQKLDLMSSC